MQPKKLIFRDCPHHQHQWKVLLFALFLIASSTLTLARPTHAVAENSLAATTDTIITWGASAGIPPTGLSNIVAIDAGRNFGLALKADGTVVTWGENTYGQQNVPAGLNNAIAISSRHTHSLALKRDGTVVAWGFNWAGQIDVPANLTNVKAIAAGISHSLALKNDGTVVAWGYNNFGQSTVPAGLNNVIAIAAGAEHNLALKSDGTVVAWGNSAYTSVPAGLNGVVAIAANSIHSLALKANGTVVAWGSNDYGQVTVPANLTGVVAIAAGYPHSLALKNDGTVVVWGDNSSGQRNVPAGLTGVTAIAAGQSHSLAFIKAGPELTVQANGVSLVNGDKINVPVVFTGNGASIASVGFALDYQESCLSFDATDSDTNGIPDTITGLPAAFAPSISHQPGNSGAELEIALYDDSSPITPLSDGTLFTVQFTVLPACLPTAGAPTNVAVNFAASPAVSFGDPTGVDVTGTASGAPNITLQPTAPTAIALSNSSIAENSPANTTVGAFSTTDPTTGDSHTYTLVSGTGDTDNANFSIEGNMLKSAALFDYETKNSYTIRVRTTDNSGNFFAQSFTITVTDVNEAPTAVDDLVDPRTTVFLGGQTGAIDVLANDIATIGTLTVASVTQPATGGGSVTNNTSNVSYTAPNASGSATFTYQATNGSATSNSATVNVNYVANHARGDCNGNGNVAAADFIGVVLEIFDAANTKYLDKPAWWLVHTGDFAGSPLGCDANNSRNGLDNNSASITAADITCSVLIFFGHACGTGVQAANMAQAAHLAVADQQATVGATTTLTVTLNTGGNAIAAATFALGLDSAVLNFDTTDADADGVPDAITLNTPAGMSRSASWNATAKRLEVAVFGMSLPLPTLTDGTLATVSIAVANDTSATSTPLALDLVSFSDADGHDLPFTEQDGTLTIDTSNVQRSLFLPLVVRY